MKIFEVVAIKETLDIKKVGDVWRIIQTDTGEFASEILFKSPGDAEVARDAMKAKMKKILTTKTPKTDIPKLSTLVPGIPNDTPTYGSLTPGQKKKLGRHGSVRINGRKFTAKMIDQATDAFAKYKAGKASDIVPDDKSKKPKADTPDDTKKQGLVKKIITYIMDSKVGPLVKLLARFFTSTLAVKIIALFNIAAFEDALDGYVRSIENHGKTLKTNGQKLAFIQDLKKGILPPAVEDAYLACVEKFVRIITEGVAAGLATFLTFKTAGAALAGLAGFIGTGPVGWIVAIIAGGALIWGGTELIAEILDAVGFADLIEDGVAQILTPRNMFSSAEVADGLQELIGGVAGSVYEPAGNLIKDSEDKNAPTQLKERKSRSEIRSNLQKMMQDNPKLRQAFEKGKPKGKQVVAQIKAEEA